MFAKTKKYGQCHYFCNLEQIYLTLNKLIFPSKIKPIGHNAN